MSNPMSSVVRRLRFDPLKGRAVEVEGPSPLTLDVPAFRGLTEDRPAISESAGVLPRQVAEAREIVKRRGLTGIEVLPTGQVKFTSRGKAGKGGRNGWNAMRGKTDADGGLGDV